MGGLEATIDPIRRRIVSVGPMCGTDCREWCTMKGISRRQMLRRSVAAAFVTPYVISSLRAGTPASERITMGAIGLGGQGMHNLKSFLTFPDVRVLAICDVDANHRQTAKKTVDDAYGNKDCVTCNDFQEVLARRDIDTVLIATPDHWHAILAIEAAKAGKDIYCEKPISLTIAEGRAVADTMKRLGTVYQSGTQRRSIACFRFGVDIARSGMLGKLQTLHCYYFYCNRFILSRRDADAAGTDPCEHASGRSSPVRCGRARC